MSGLPGNMTTGEGRLFIGCAVGVVEVLAVQPAGKAEMSASAFLRGYGRRLSDGRLERVRGLPGACAGAEGGERL